jgi:PPIC-type PPIASE domain
MVRGALFHFHTLIHMSTTLPIATPDSPATARRGLPLPNWIQEPLLHFIVLGGLLFAADHFIVGRAQDPRTIVVTAEVNQDIRQLFQSSRSRDPNADELKALHERWLDNEVLYREGLALQVDRGDTAIRERVIFKALSVVDANVKRPALDDQVLRAWFERNRARYDEPARYDFQEAVMAGDTSEAAVRGFARALNAGAPSDERAGLRVFKGRPHDNLVQSYGADFAQAVERAAPGQWQALRGGDGWRAIRLDAVAPPKPAVFEPLRGIVLQDWTDAVMAEQRTAAVRALGKKYTVKFESATK